MPIEYIIRNIKRSIRDYRIYFYTLMIFSAIFYVFNAIKENVPELQFDIGQINLIVSIIFALLLLYANHFMIRQRRQEFATLALLGMSLGTVSLILCVETCVVIILSLGIGLPCGMLFSQLANLFIRTYLYGNSEGYTFTVSAEAVISITKLYAVIMFFVCLFNVLFIGRNKLYLLLKEDYIRSRSIPKTGYLRPTLLLSGSLFLLLINRIILGDRLNSMPPIVVVLAFLFSMMSIFLMIRSAFLFLSAFASTDKGNRYVLEIRFITDGGYELTYFMTAVSIIILVAFVLVGGSFGIVNNLRKISLNERPCDIMITGKDNVLTDMEKADMAPDDYFSSYVQVNIYHDPDITYSDIFAGSQNIHDDYLYIYAKQGVDLMTESDYNRLAAECGYDRISLGENGFVIISDMFSFKDAYDKLLASDRTLTVNGHVLTSVYDYCVEKTVFLSSSKMNSGLFIVPDSTVTEDMTDRFVLMGNYISPDVEEDLLESVSLSPLLNSDTIETSSMIRNNYRNMTLDTVYISFYTSCVFVICSLAVLSFKEMLTIGSRTSMLKSLALIGFPDEEIRRYFLCHITTIFAIPTIAAFFHSGYIIRAFNHFFENVGLFNIGLSYLAFTLFLFPILITFFVLSYKTSVDLSYKVRNNTDYHY